MKALDVMVRDVVTGEKPEDDVTEAIRLLGERDVSALPVVDDGGNVVGVISEADLLHRQEIGTEKQRPWWLEAVTPACKLAEEFASCTAGALRRSCRQMSFRFHISDRWAEDSFHRLCIANTTF